MQNNTLNEESENDFQLKAIVMQYVSHWKWFVFSVFLCLSLAFLFLRYSIPEYKASTTILIKGDSNGGIPELAAFANLVIGGGNKNNIDNELEILKSRTLMETTVKKLNLNISLISIGKVISEELFVNPPITVNFINQSADFYSLNTVLEFSGIGANTFSIKGKSESSATPFIVNAQKEYKYGQPIKTRYGDLIINNSNIHNASLINNERDITIVIRPLEGIADSFRNRLVISPLSKSGGIFELSLIDPVSAKAEAFLDNLVELYNEDAKADKNLISRKTSAFIASRLSLIAEELDGVEQDVESFKNSNKLIDIESETKLFIDGSGEYNKKGIDVEIQLNVLKSMLDFINKSNNSELLPSTVVGDASASGSINAYNQLILDRNRLLKSATTENPSVIKMDQQIASLKMNIISSLKRLQSNLNIEKANLSSQEGLLDRKIEKIPSQEKQFRAIARQQKVKEELYLYLLQKREASAISLSATELNARVIDMARASKSPVSPKRSMIYLGALLIGILFPFGVIYLMDLLDTKIKSRLDLEGKTLIPFIGDVPTSEDASQIIQSGSRTSSAEALRIIRTNLEFMVNRVPEGLAKTIFLTSTFPKEGKTFISVNLAATFALSGKKVLLIGMDIRNPKLDEYLTIPERGFTNYLSSKDLKLEELIIQHDGYDHFHILPAGIIPPNPAELLMSKKVESLFENLKKQYDYIIVDTAPVSLVTDTLLIAKHADCFVYVARANFLEKRMLNIPNTLFKENKLPNMCILLNDTDSTKGYGYGYGYGVKAEKEAWYKRFLKK